MTLHTGVVAAARDDKIASGQCDDALDLGGRRPDVDRRERRTKARARKDRDEKRGNVVQARENDVARANPDLSQCYASASLHARSSPYVSSASSETIAGWSEIP